MSINPWGSDDPAEVAKGGTGNSTLTDHGVLLGSGTSPVTVTAAPTNGQLLIGSTGADPAIDDLGGDTDEISITAGAGSLAIGIADNCVLPGTDSFTWVSGTTAQEPTGAAGETRYDTDTDKFRGYIDGTGWVDFSTGGGGGGTDLWEVISLNTSIGPGTEVTLSGYTQYLVQLNNFASTGTSKQSWTMTIERSGDDVSTDHSYANNTGAGGSNRRGATGTSSGLLQYQTQFGFSGGLTGTQRHFILITDCAGATNNPVYWSNHCISASSGASAVSSAVGSGGGVSINNSSSSAMSGISFQYGVSDGSPVADILISGKN